MFFDQRTEPNNVVAKVVKTKVRLWVRGKDDSKEDLLETRVIIALGEE